MSDKVEGVDTVRAAAGCKAELTLVRIDLEGFIILVLLMSSFPG